VVSTIAFLGEVVGGGPATRAPNITTILRHASVVEGEAPTPCSSCTLQARVVPTALPTVVPEAASRRVLPVHELLRGDWPPAGRHTWLWDPHTMPAAAAAVAAASSGAGTASSGAGTAGAAPPRGRRGVVTSVARGSGGGSGGGAPRSGVSGTGVAPGFDVSAWAPYILVDVEGTQWPLPDVVVLRGRGSGGSGSGKGGSLDATSAMNGPPMGVCTVGTVACDADVLSLAREDLPCS
jgi:hypothetical protein